MKQMGVRELLRRSTRFADVAFKSSPTIQGILNYFILDIGKAKVIMRTTGIVHQFNAAII